MKGKQSKQKEGKRKDIKNNMISGGWVVGKYLDKAQKGDNFAYGESDFRRS